MTRQRLRNARLAVFGTPELLEQVILYLPPLDIVIVQRICKCFLSTIVQSPRIQERLFLRSAQYDAPTIKLTWEDGWGRHPPLNMTLHEQNEPHFEPLKLTSTTAEQPTRANVAMVQTHPLLTPLCFGKNDTGTDEPPFFYYANFDLFRLLDGSRRSPQRSMFLTQPPVKSVIVNFEWSVVRDPARSLGRKRGHSSSGLARRLVTDLNGMTFGRLADSLQEAHGWRQHGWHGLSELEIDVEQSPMNLMQDWEKRINGKAEQLRPHDIFEMTLKFQDVYLKAVEGAHMWDRAWDDWFNEERLDRARRGAWEREQHARTVAHLLARRRSSIC